MRYIKLILLVILLVVLPLVGCSAPATPEPIPESTATNSATEIPVTSAPAETAIPELPLTLPLVSESEIELVAKSLRGECYDDQPDDKREVVKVICNRVSAGGFGDSIEAVITAPRQFAGYHPDNEPTENDYAIAREVLTAWYEGGCAPMGEYLFFSSGSGHKNIFRKEWKEGSSS